MEPPAAIHNTFVIERTYPAPPELVFSAFADPTRKRRWFVESDHAEVLQHELDFRPGGRELAQMRFKPGTPVAGFVCTVDTTYYEIVPNRLILFAASMKMGDKCISGSLCTIELLPAGVGAGTELIFTHHATFLEGADGPEMRHEGWRTLFQRLAEELAR